MMLFDSYKFIDLTHLITPNIPTWDRTCGFSLENIKDYDPHGHRSQKIHLQAGVGTHMDAPGHFIRGGDSIDDISLQKLIVPVCLINLADKADENYQLSVEDIVHYEEQYGRILENSFVIVYTGWSRHWPDSERYLNLDKNHQMRFPSISKEAAEFLVKREIAGLGIDTLSPDCGPLFPVHNLLLKEGKYIVENIANGHLMPPQGAYIILLPLNMDSTESPIRAVGIISKT